MIVGQHNFDQPSNLSIIPSQEPSYESTIPKNFMTAVSQFGSCPFAGFRAGLSTSSKHLSDIYQFIKYNESLVYIHKIVQSLINNGIQQEDRCIIFGKNSPLWIMSDLAISFANGVSAPIYDTLGLDNIIYCINLVQAKYVFVSGDYLPTIIGMMHKIPSVSKIFSFDQIETEVLTQQAHKVFAQLSDVVFDIPSHSETNSVTNSVVSAIPESAQCLDFSQVDSFIAQLDKIVYLTNFHQPTEERIEEARKFLTKQIEKINQKPNDINSTIFTSGTSGLPKAVLVTHKNLIAGGTCVATRFVPYHLNDKGKQTSSYSYLPLAHTFERGMTHCSMFRGFLIYYSSGSIKNMTKDLQLAKPSYMMGVPRVYSKIYQVFTDKLNKQPLILRGVFNSAFKLKQIYFKLNPKAFRTGKMPVVDKVFKQVAQAFGGNLEMIISGSSALPQKVKDFLEITSCARLSVGYGITETCVTGLHNTCGQKFNTPNQLGYMSAYTEGKLIDRSDKCEFTLEKDQIGELTIKGPGVALGYLDSKWGSIKPIVDSDGYYHTGDLVQIHQDKTISFVRRVGLVVKLQQGEFVDLEAIEAAIESLPLVLTAVAHAEADKVAPVCILSVDSIVLSQALDSNIVAQFKKGDATAIKTVEQYMFETGNKAVRQKGLKGFNVPKAYHIVLDTDWTSNTDLFTPSQKKKHQNFVNTFRKEINQLWNIVNQREFTERNKNNVIQSKNKSLHLFYVTFILIAIYIVLKFVRITILK
ncbi:Long_chain fatty acid CoA ligase [Hexamita inflata]|uniref:Long chain fatty acid CoA ligase n=1 Tax=Hexamita inflata TaxID=28002 RepID=A0AA86NIS9_9EUKA|nr:Long chain fatty acid CoA ligase [Hexamita inflata]